MEVVINGPVAMAGSIPLLCKNKGINVPTIPATMITATSETETAKAVWKSCCQNHMKPNKNTANIMPFSVAISISLIKRLLMLPLMSSLANPWTMMALDWTPTFPAMAAISGVNNRIRGKSSIMVSNVPMIIAALTPPIRPKNNQGNRALVSAKILSSASTSCVIPAANW